MEASLSRYAGRPLLRLVECYVLDAIGELGTAERERLESMAPTIASSLGSPAMTWQGAISDALELPPEYPESVRTDWASNKAAAAAAGHVLTADAFAAAVADSFVS